MREKKEHPLPRSAKTVAELDAEADKQLEKIEAEIEKRQLEEQK
jgi:hypothetical protein